MKKFFQEHFSLANICIIIFLLKFFFTGIEIKKKTLKYRLEQNFATKPLTIHTNISKLTMCIISRPICSSFGGLEESMCIENNSLKCFYCLFRDFNNIIPFGIDK